MELPQVTVILCNYNYGEYIEDAIDSVINQKYPKLGLVIVDDASTDDSWNIIHKKLYSISDFQKIDRKDFVGKICKLDNGIVVYSIRLNENGGPSRARNYGIVESLEGTDWYMVLDADDIMYPNKISRMVQYILGMKDVGVVYADYDIWDTEKDTRITEYKEPFDKFRLLNECIVHSGAMIKKEALLDTQDQFGFYDINMRTCEDYDLWIRISEKYVIFHAPEVLTLVRNQPQNSTRTVDNSIWQTNWNRIRAKMQARHAN